MRVVVRDVLNVGGFFAGETVTLTIQPWPDGGAEQTLTIDDAALINVTARHRLAPGMVLELAFAGDRVERAILLGTPDHAGLREAMRPQPIPATPVPRPLSFHCRQCQLWVPVHGEPPVCAVCGAPAPL